MQNIPPMPRRSERKSITLLARCRVSSGLSDEGVLSDITTEGCCIALRFMNLNAGQFIVIRPEGMEGLSGVVRWISGNRAGIEFERPLYGPVLDHLLEKYTDFLPAAAWASRLAKKTVI